MLKYYVINVNKYYIILYNITNINISIYKYINIKIFTNIFPFFNFYNYLKRKRKILYNF